MAHFAYALFFAFVFTAFALLVVRAGGALIHVLYSRPLALWSATTVVILGLLIVTDRWRSVDWRGVAHFMFVAVAAFIGVTILCETYRILKRLIGTRR